MNKKIRKVKLISRDVLESLVYYSRFNSLYACGRLASYKKTLRAG